MLRKVIVSTIALGALAVAAPAMAGGGSWGGCKFNCNTTSGGWTPPPTGSTSSTSTSTSSGGTQVPEPGMLGIAAAGLIGLGAIRARRRKAK